MCSGLIILAKQEDSEIYHVRFKVYLFRLNKSFHLFETQCAFLPLLTLFLTFYGL